MNHGIDCFCNDCKKIRKLLRDGVNSGDRYLVGLESDKNKVMNEEGDKC